jgi:hypothetical protein
MDVEEAFINHKTQFDDDNEKGKVSEATDDEEAGEHRIIVDPEDDYEQERQLNIKVKERLSQLGLSPRTLKNKRRALARDLEKKLISKCAAKHMLERPPTTSGATSSNRVAATSSRGGKGSRGGGAGGKGSRGGGQRRLRT